MNKRIRDAVRAIRTLRQNRHRIELSSAYLAPGKYAYGGAGFWVRIGSKTAFKGPNRHDRAVRQLLVSVLSGTKRIPRPGGHASKDEHLNGDSLQVRRPRHSIVFASQSSQVARVLHDRLVPERYEELRNELQSFVPGPAFTVSQHRDAIVDGFVDGKPLSLHSSSDQVLHARTLLEQLSCASSSASDSDRPTSSLPTLLQSLGNSCLGAEFSGRERVAGLVAAPQAVSHGDLHPGNVIVTTASFRPVVIDWEPAYLAKRPYWFDALTLLLTQRPLLTEFWNGSLDDSLRALSLAWGRSADELISDREIVLFCWVLFSTSATLSTRASSTREDVRQSVQQRLRELRSARY